MPTHYFLHGGESSRKSEKNSEFFKKILLTTNKKSINILCVYFARPEHRWMESFYEDRTSFEEQEVGLDGLYIDIADKDNFREQLIKADVIFINGGFKGFLKEKLLSISDLGTLIENKIVVGISAGANILSKYYYSQGGSEIREGIGLLPIKVFCHFDENCTSELELLRNYKEDLPIYKIREEEFVEL